MVRPVVAKRYHARQWFISAEGFYLSLEAMLYLRLLQLNSPLTLLGRSPLEPGSGHVAPADDIPFVHSQGWMLAVLAPSLYMTLAILVQHVQWSHLAQNLFLFLPQQRIIHAWKIGCYRHLHHQFSIHAHISPFLACLGHRQFAWTRELDADFHVSNEGIIHEWVEIFDIKCKCLRPDWSRQGIGYFLSQKH